MKYILKFYQSFREIRRLRTVCMCGMLTVLYVLSSFFFTVYLTNELRLEFSFLFLAFAGYMFGPFCAMTVGMAGDLIQYFIKPAGPYFPGFTLSAMLIGIIFGLLLYKEKPSLLRCGVARVLVTVFINIILNTFFLSVLYGNGYLVLLWPRVIKNAVLLLVEIPLCYGLIQAIRPLKNKMFTA